MKKNPGGPGIIQDSLVKIQFRSERARKKCSGNICLSGLEIHSRSPKTKDPKKYLEPQLDPVFWVRASFKRENQKNYKLLV